MLIAHISDTHLGASQFGLREREEDVYDAFNEIIETVIKDRVKVVVHSGDIFDTPKPGGTPLVKLLNGLQKLNEKGIKFYFTLGEHDISRIPETPSSFLFEKIDLARYVGNGKPLFYDGIAYVGLHKYKRSEIDELISKLRSIDRQVFDYPRKKVLILHQGLYEFHRYAGEITVSDLPKNFDYYAFGHLHDRHEKRFEELKGILCYPGSIDPIPGEGIKDFEKGFYIVDLSGDEARPEWVKIKSTRKQMNVELEYSKLEQAIQELLEDIKGLQKPPVLYIKVKGKELDSRRITNALSKLNQQALYYEWEPAIEGSEVGRVFKERPSNIDEEMMNLTAEILESKEKASFVIKELLSMLSEGLVKEAFELMWKNFKEERVKS